MMTNENITALIVDDQDRLTGIMSKRLRRRGLNVLTVNSGEACLEALDQHPDIDVVVLDIRMPGMDGLQTLAEIRKRHPLVQTIMHTGHPTPENGLEGQALGAFYYLAKPANIDELEDLMHSAKARKIRKEHQSEAV